MVLGCLESGYLQQHIEIWKFRVGPALRLCDFSVWAVKSLQYFMLKLGDTVIVWALDAHSVSTPRNKLYFAARYSLSI